MITMTPEEATKRKEEWLERMKREGKLTRNPTEDHKFGLKVLQNTMRREILISLGSERKSFEEIKEKFNLNDSMANFHLNMLEDALYIEKIEEEGKVFYVPTPRGEGYVENVEMKK
ncbi:MAG: winged helix-turn-helix domain-containing protein [Methanosarcina sp.]|nr:winged helix-turn-helix domain-containing protein [Methanosarcina sp.]MDD3246283.1 winged helix-turn-helix domain-containing protein [Methanosarcina sp.]